MEIYTGTVEGTGAAINITCGFKPAWVDLYNIDGDVVLNWTSDMGAAKGYKTAGADGVAALIASDGVTQAVHSTGAVGFIIGADADVNANGETICWKAGR